MQTILCFILLAACSFGLGRLCLWRVRFARQAEEFVFSTAVGMVVLAYAVLLLGAVGWMSPLVVSLTFAVGCFASVPVVSRFAGRIQWRAWRPDPLSLVCLAVLVGAAGLNAVCTLNPILEVDTYEYHIAIPKAWLVAARVFPIPYCLQSNYHFLAEMLNVIALALSQNDVVLCKLIQWYAGLLLAVATWCFGRSFFSARVAWVAATLVYLIKEISWISASGYIDLTHGLYLWLGIYAMIRAVCLRRWNYHAFAGIFFGCAFATKQSGAMFAVIAYVACLAALAVDRRRRPDIRYGFAQALLAGAVALAVGSPWLIKNYIVTGDPFFPFLVARFNVPHEFAEAAPHFTGYYGGLARYVIWDSETWPQLVRAFKNFNTNVMYSGANLLVVWLLISGLLLIVARSRPSLALRLLIAIGIFGAPWFAWTWSRFFFGYFPAYVLVLVQSLRLATGRRLPPRTGRRAFALISVVLLFFYARTFIRYNYTGRPAKPLAFTGGPIFSATARERWLIQNNHPYPAIKRVNRLLGRNDRLLATGVCEALPWIDVPFLPNTLGSADHPLRVLWDRFQDADAVRRWLEAQRITHLTMAAGEADALDRDTGFVTGHLDRLFTVRGVSLYRLRPRLPAPAGAGSGID